MDAGARGPGDAGFVDILAESGVGLVAIINDEVEPKAFLAVWKANFVEGNRGLENILRQARTVERASAAEKK